MRILVLEKTRISGKSHTKNLKVVILYMWNFPLMREMHLFRKGRQSKNYFALMNAYNLIAIQYKIYWNNALFMHLANEKVA